jgi:hypothetical protein
MTLDQAIGQEGIQLLNDIRANMGAAGMNATNETSHSLRIEQSREGNVIKMKLLGRPYFFTVQTGRKPTPDKKPSREMIQRITRWVEARSIDLEAVWGIATNIQKKGTKLWQAGGRTDIIDPAIEDFVNNVSRTILEFGAQEIKRTIKELEW